MNPNDISTQLTKRLSAILEDCKRIEPALSRYLKETDERPPIQLELLRILSNALAAYDLVVSEIKTGQFHGVPREQCGEPEPDLTISHTERPGWNFQPWLAEKLHATQKGAKGLTEDWLTELHTVVLKKNAPMTPQEWLRSGLMMNFHLLKDNALAVFEEVCLNKLEISQSQD